MILTEASEKYSFPLDRLCRAVSAAGVEPTGERQGKRKKLKEYDEKDLLDAIMQDYKQRFMKAKGEAEHWKIKASQAISLYVRDHPKPIEEDDL